MAERRMFAKTIIDSDEFLDMPLSTQSLYFHLNMRADDDGFINNPKRIQKMIGASDDDMKLLIAKSFVLVFESGVIVIKHWRLNNYIQKDRYKETIYKDEKSRIEMKENGIYNYTDNACIQNGYKMDTQVRLGKVSLGKSNLYSASNEAETTTTNAKKRFVKPSVMELKAYAEENGYEVDAQYFYDYYEANGWKIGKNPMKDWQATLRNWARNNKNWKPKAGARVPDTKTAKEMEQEFHDKYDDESEMPF